MAAFLLLVLALGGSVVVADLVRENLAAGEVTVFHQAVTSYPEGWLLAMAAGLGFVVALLLVASVSSTKGRARRGQRRRPRRGPQAQVVEPKPDQDRLLDEFFGPDASLRHVARPARPARPAHLRGVRREGQVGRDQRRDAPRRVEYHPEPLHVEARRAAGQRDDTDLPFPARDGRRW
jgi:hypothetical protein